MTSDPSTPRNDGLAKRVASAAVLIPATVGAVHVGGAVFAALVAALAIIMVFEWTRMIERRDLGPAFYATALPGAFAFLFAGAGHFGAAFVLCILAAASAAAAKRRDGLMRWAGFGAFYILAPSVALLWLRGEVDNGRALTLMLFVIVWAADTGGYIAGRLVGGPKMSPAVSPAKTWAGAVGGLIMGAGAGYLGARWIYGEGPEVFYLLAGAALGLASILGDMAESAFKRVFGVKDTSGLIPGHGGALDRLDGMIFATTAMTLVLYLHVLLGRLEG